jgi:multicomponent Na+:H+ antiporter subunit D
MVSHISLLLVVVPLIAAPVVAVLPRGRLPWAVAFFVAALCAVLAGMQLWAVLHEGTISYELGGWAPPWGIEYRIDAVNAFVALIVASIAAITLPYALLSAEQEIPEEKIPLFYSALLLCLTGLLGITQTGDIFNVFVFLEISSLASYALISLGRHRQALTAAYQYLIMGTIGATFYLIGVGLIYSQTGSLNMQDLATILPGVLHLRTVETGFAFIMIGIALKLAMFPLHLWLPNAYTYAPSVVTIFLAATATKVAVYVMLRILFMVFPQGYAVASPAEQCRTSRLYGTGDRICILNRCDRSTGSSVQPCTDERRAVHGCRRHYLPSRCMPNGSDSWPGQSDALSAALVLSECRVPPGLSVNGIWSQQLWNRRRGSRLPLSCPALCWPWCMSAN